MGPQNPITNKMDVRINLLLRKALEGDIAAYQEIVEKYQRPVLALLWSQIGHFQRSRELTEEVFLKVYSSLKMLGDFNKFPNWLAKTALSHLSQKSPPPSNQDPSPLQQFYSTLQRLPENHRQVFWVKFYGELSYEEVSEMLDVPLSTVRGILFKGTSLLSPLFS